MVAFQYHPGLLARYPGIVGGVILARAMTNGPTPDDLRDAYLAEQRATIARIGATPLSELPSLAAWRRAFSGFGVAPTQYRSAAEALLRRLTKQGDIPSINALVDLGNLVSIRYALPVAVFDARAIAGAVTVRFADGSERFTNLGQSEPEHPEPGEVIFADETGMVIARRWCWRQSDESAARPDTSAAIVTVEAHHADARADVEAAQRDLLALLDRYAGGEHIAGILDSSAPAIPC
jgi:DNA/RNA-binding domain of Phe-tRNA-synthetase-like protein